MFLMMVSYFLTNQYLQQHSMKPKSNAVPSRPAAVNQMAAPPPQNAGGKRKDSCLNEIQRLQKERDERRKNMDEKRVERKAEEKRNRDNGNPGDVDFQRMIRDYREENANIEQHHSPPGEMKICICVRKRPINSKEIRKHDHDSVSCFNPVVIVHDCKLKVDGITKYLDNTSFEVDHTFHEDDTTDDVYMYSVQPLVDFVIGGGRATVFAYGQTGSGKTFTMMGIQKFIAEDLFQLLEACEESLQIFVSFFEIYGGRCQDLLNNRHRLSVLEDGGGEVVIGDLEETEVNGVDEMLKVIDLGNRNRTTHATESNDVSSRSHAICQVTLRHANNGKLHGKLSLIDLAGSERGADTKSHNRQRRMEGAEINKSLLALKECIRALDSNSTHVPYRASKLTLVLKDSFTRKTARTVMIANVSPAASSADHTLNTLRYADRVKERVVGGQAAKNNAAAAKGNAAQGYDQGQGNGAKEPSREDRGGGGGGGRGGGGNGRGAKVEVDYTDDADMDNDDFNGNDEEDDLKYLYGHRGGRGGGGGGNGQEGGEEEEDAGDLEEFTRTVQGLFDEEEALLNTHMSVIQENATLLTEEGRLLQEIQGEEVVDYDIDRYASRLDAILERKQELIVLLQRKLAVFRTHLQNEEKASKRIGRIPNY